MTTDAGGTPPRSRVFDTAAPRFAGGLAYSRAGAGEPLLLLHGLASSRGAFNDLVPLLSQHFDVISVDLPGHGDSPRLGSGDVMTPASQARAVARLLDELAIDRAHLVGNSMGGWVALELAADGRAASVTGLCPAGLWEPPVKRDITLEINRRLAITLAPVTPLLLHVAPLREFLFRNGVERPYRVSYHIARTTADGQRRADGYDEAHDGMLHRRFQRAQEIPDTVPVTVLFGDNDKLLTVEQHQIRSLAPDHARWIVMPRVGHAPMWDDPEHSAAEIRATATAAQRGLREAQATAQLEPDRSSAGARV